MMKVIGEEGTSIKEFIDYLKGEFFDAVYLQQNAFDKTDEATIAERQQYVYGVIVTIIDKEFDFDSRDAARKFFQELRQKFINWNSAEFNGDEFKQIEKDIQTVLA